MRHFIAARVHRLKYINIHVHTGEASGRLEENYLFIYLCGWLSLYVYSYLSTPIESISIFMYTLGDWKKIIYLTIYVAGYLSVYIPIYLSIYGSTALADLGRFFSFLIPYIVVEAPWKGDQPVVRPLLPHRKTQTENKCTQTSILCVGFEPTIPAFERAKTVHASDRAATVVGIDIAADCRRRCLFPWSQYTYYMVSNNMSR
jgi:hypothetical protein